MASSAPIGEARSSAPLARVDRLAGLVASIGAGGFAWPLAVGAGIGTSIAVGFERLRVKHPGFPLGGVGPGLLTALFTAAVALAAYGVARARARRGAALGVGALYRDTLHRIAALAAIPLVVACGEPIEYRRGWTVFALAAATGGLVTFSAYHWVTDRGASTSVRTKRVAQVAVTLLMVAYAVTAARLGIINHLAFNTGRSDLGYYLSVFRQSSQGIPLGCSLCGGGNHLTGHFDPILIPLSPLFLIYPWAETLLVIQAIWLASGAVPVYLLARAHTLHRGAAVAFATAYLAYPALHGVNLFDFHSIALSIPLILWLLYFIEQERARAAYIALAACVLVREDVSLATALIGVSCIFSGNPKRANIGWVTVVASAMYFLVAKVVFMGHADPLNAGAQGKGYSQFYEELIPPGRSTAGLLGTVLGDPLFTLTRVLTEIKLDYVGQLLVPLLALPLLARGRIQLAYGAAITLLSTSRAIHSVHFQYSSTLVPVLFGLAMSALGRIRNAPPSLGASGPRLAKALAFGVLGCTLLCSWKFGGFIDNDTFAGGFRPLQREASADSRADDLWLRKFASSLPRGAKVAANTRIIPHLGPVTSIMMIEDRYKADYVVANIKNPDVSRAILPDLARGYLVEVESRGIFHIYRTRYPVAARTAKPDAEIEAEQNGAGAQ